VEVPFHDTYKEHSIVFTLRGPNNEELPLRIEARFRSTATHDAVFGEPHLVPLAANVVNIEFRQPGSYNFLLSFDGKELGRYALRATQDVTATIGR
jgi:hypothetical protein